MSSGLSVVSEWALAPNIFVLEMNAQWVAIVWKQLKQGIHLQDINLFPMSSEASEWASEWAQRSARVKQAVWRKKNEWARGVSEQTSGWANGQVLYASIS